MSEIVREFVSYDKKLTCRLYLDTDDAMYLSSVDLNGEEIACKRFVFEGKFNNNQKLSHFMGLEFLRGAMKAYEALMIKGFKEA